MTKQEQKLNKFRVVLRMVSRGLAMIVLFLAIPLFVQGTTLYLEPSNGEYHQGDTFLVEVRIDIEDECINVVDVNLSFSQDILEADSFSRGGSILTLWAKEPVIDQALGLVSFSGGIPGGYCGILPGDLEMTSLLGKIVFQARETDAKLMRKTDPKIDFLEETQVLLNDGLGTPAKLSTKGAIFTILPKPLEPLFKDEWRKELEKDVIPPELFEIEVEQGPAIFDGKYFITFSTTDKQTGLDYYEVSETRDKRQEEWKRAESPYLLEDQELKSIIRVRAVDKAGNERVVEYLPYLLSKKSFPYWIIILILAGIVIAKLSIAKLRKIKMQNHAK